ncbi:hypothetical protein FVE85_6861 [Porphyridium purpureum]|uniref:HTH La-type RNA-binding domain-containing protein n=1 Tax=Porphyridium purpureum TaxID=35688 RepID=A0A5J4Z6G6_PORPP|nr:hypothetical protein FVE85_6861 [Porphyridium purpureum]|eukprot:POR7604..scf295_1
MLDADVARRRAVPVMAFAAWTLPVAVEGTRRSACCLPLRLTSSWVREQRARSNVALARARCVIRLSSSAGKNAAPVPVALAVEQADTAGASSREWDRRFESPSEQMQQHHPMLDKIGPMPEIPEEWRVAQTSELSKEERMQQIQKQLEFYLSTRNLRSDTYVRLRLDAETAAIPVAEFLIFYRMISLNATAEDIVKAAGMSSALTVFEDSDPSAARIAPAQGSAIFAEAAEVVDESACVVAQGVHPMIPTRVLLNLFESFGKCGLLRRPRNPQGFRKLHCYVEFEHPEGASACLSGFDALDEGLRMGVEGVMKSSDFRLEQEKRARFMKRILRVHPLPKEVDTDAVEQWVWSCKDVKILSVDVRAQTREAFVLVAGLDDAEEFADFVRISAEYEREANGGEDIGDSNALARPKAVLETTVAELLRSNTFKKVVATMPKTSLPQRKQRTPSSRQALVVVEGLDLDADLSSDGMSFSHLYSTLKEAVPIIRFLIYRSGSPTCVMQIGSVAEAEQAVKLLNGALDLKGTKPTESQEATHDSSDESQSRQRTTLTASILEGELAEEKWEEIRTLRDRRQQRLYANESEGEREEKPANMRTQGDVDEIFVN